MSLNGAKIICLSADDGSYGDIIPAQGRTFKFGYYMNCDVVLEHSDALGVHCSIDCDSFGRVTIENQCPERPITLDGVSFKKMRPLLDKTEICILDKKYLWRFEGCRQSVGFQTEDAEDFATPCKQAKKAQQPPMSEPARRWRTQYQKRLTIHSFAYSIKAGESPLDVEVISDENKPLNTHERVISPDPESAPRKSSSTSLTSDLINLKTPKVSQRSFTGRRTPLSCCKFSETVITSYSPRETGVRPDKSFAIVQSPSVPTKKSTALPDVSLGPFKHVSSPLTLNHRPSMHLIDLTTPMKRVPEIASPNATLLKSTLKKNTPKGKSVTQQQQSSSKADTSAVAMDSTVYSVHSTDESVIELSDDGSFSPSPVISTPTRPRTPQSLMKRAILGSAKKAAITKRLQQPPKPPPPVLSTPRNPPGPSNIRFQSLSTPQRKSLGRLQSPDERSKASLSVAGKVPKSMITSTPFRAGESTASGSRRSSILRSPSTSLTGLKNKSRVSLMLTQALSKSPVATPRRKSVTFMEGTKGPSESLIKERKSISFLDRIESEEVEHNSVLDQTFSLEEQKDGAPNAPKNDATFSPEKEEITAEGVSENPKDVRSDLPTILVPDEEDPIQNSTEDNEEKASHESQPTKAEKLIPETSTSRKDAKRLSAFKPLSGLSPFSKDRSMTEPRLNITFSPEKDDPHTGNETDEQTTDKTPTIDPTPTNAQSDSEATKAITEISLSSTKDSKQIISTPPLTVAKAGSDDDLLEDYEGLDAIFKTPKARNLMILSSPKSISLQKPTTDSVELIHSTEFDLSANLDDIFKTPQSELIPNRAETDTTLADALSSEEAFDKLVGRPINRRSYVRKPTPPKKQELSPISVAKDRSLPKTDIEEWIDNVNESVEFLADDHDNENMSYLTTTTTQSETSRDPLMLSSIGGSVNATKRKNQAKSPTDESVMTVQEDDEECEENVSALKDPLEMTVQNTPRKSLSPNISGIDLLDHTSESLFSETLAVSDESSGEKDVKTNNTLIEGDKEETITHLDGDIQISPDKARREMERAFANFEAERKIIESKRLVSTPEPKKPVSKVAPRRTLGNQQTLHTYFDVKMLKEEREMELAFEKFEQKPRRLAGERLAKTPEVEKRKKDSRKTMGNNQGEVIFDVSRAKAERDMELAFENFEENPNFSKERAVQTPEPKKPILKDHRRTMGSQLVSEVTLDLEAAKNEREMELAFEKFQEEPNYTIKRVVNTPEPRKTSAKDHRRTMGSSLISDVTFDLKAAKEQREMELAFENFEEEPEFSEKRDVRTPEPEKASLKNRRRTMGSSLVSKVTLDLNKAKKEREMELIFENFEEEPVISNKRVVKTPQPKKTFSKDHRRTMGSNLNSEVKLDLKAVKAQRDIELAFKNFEEEPEFLEKREVKTPEPRKTTSKDQRRTMGSNLLSEVTLDLEAAKAELEMELAFEHFVEDPEFGQERIVKTPEPKKVASKDHRRTMGTNLISEVTIDLQEAREQREMELAFENFEDEPEFSAERAVKTPGQKKTSIQDHRRSMGSTSVSNVTFDLQEAKAQREMELAFENFKEEPEFSENRGVKTPEPKKIQLKDHRRTMGSNMVLETNLDLKAAKAEREMEQAFENFEEEPEYSDKRVVQTPQPKKALAKDHRRTVGSGLVSEVTLDLKAAKEKRQMELDFENFEEEPLFTNERGAQTPEAKKVHLKDHRRTMGNSLVSKVTIDLKKAKSQREMELAFVNFKEEPEYFDKREARTPEPRKSSLKDRRRTVGSNLGSEVTLDMEAAKEERELELAFENFEEEPTFSDERIVKTPEIKRTISKDHRRTMGSSLITEVTLDLKEAKAQRDMELAFENFEVEPEISNERVAKTPEPQKTTKKNDRRTMGSNLVTEVTLDLKEAKARREMELAFENFEEEPEISNERVAKTPEPQKATKKSDRRTMGSNLVTEITLDLKEAKAQREMELAFENFEEEPEISNERVAKTPELQKATKKNDRRTMGSNLVTEVTLDLKEAKAQREMELAFENFEEEITLDLKEAKAQHEKVDEQAAQSSSQPRNRRRRQSNKGKEVNVQDQAEDIAGNATGEAENVHELEESKKEDKNELQGISTPTISQPRTRRQRLKTLDEQLKLEEKVDDESTPNTIQSRNRRRYRNTTDEEQKVEEPKQNASNSSASLVDKAGKPSGPKEDVDNDSKPTYEREEVQHQKKDAIKSNQEDQTISQPLSTQTLSQSRSRRRRQISVDDSEQLKCESKPETKQSTLHVTGKRRKNPTDEDEIRKDAVESSGVDSTDDESKHAPSTRKKRLRKASAASSHTGVEVHPQLDPIVEEEKRQRTPSIDQELTPEAGVEANQQVPILKDDRKIEPEQSVELETDNLKISAEKKQQTPSVDEEVPTDASVKETNKSGLRRAIRKEATKQADTSPEEDSALKIKSDLEEIITSSPAPSDSRIRGRKAHLNVVVVEPKSASAAATLSVDTAKEGTWHTLSLKLESANRSENNKTEELPFEVEDTEIQATPVPSKTRGRRLASKAESTVSSAPTLRRGRRGSVHDENTEHLLPTTPGPIKAKGRKAALTVKPVELATEKLTPARRKGRSGVEDDVENVIPSTPVPLKTRGRRAAAKELEAEHVNENLTEVVDSIGERKKSEETTEVETEVQPVNKDSTPKDNNEHDADIQAAEANANVADSSNRKRSSNLEDSVVELETPEDNPSTDVLTKTRGRRAALKAVQKQTTAASSTPDRKSRKKGAPEETVEKVVDPSPDNSTQDENTAKATAEIRVDEEVPLVTKARGRKATIKVKQEDVSEEVAPAEEPSKKRGRKAVEPTRETSTPAKKGRRRIAIEKVMESPERSTQIRAETELEEVISLPIESHSQNVTVKVEPVEPVEPTAESTVQEELSESVAQVQGTESEEVVPSKKRGRKAVDALEKASTPARRGRRRVAVEKTQEVEKLVEAAQDKSHIQVHAEAEVEEVLALPTVKVELGEPTVESTNQEDVSEHTAHEIEPKEGMTSKKRGRKAVEPMAKSPIRARKGRRGLAIGEIVETKVIDSASESSTQVHSEIALETKPSTRKSAINLEPVGPTAENESQEDVSGESIQAEVEQVAAQPSKTRGRKAAINLEPVGPTTESASQEDVSGQSIQAEVEQVAAQPSKTRGRKAAVKVETVKPNESSTPLRKRGRRGIVDDEAAAPTSSTTLSHSAVIKLEHTEVVISTPARKRGRRGAVVEDTAVRTDEDDVVKAVPSEKRKRAAVISSESTVEQSSEPQAEFKDLQNVSQPKRRGRIVASKPQPTEEKDEKDAEITDVHDSDTEKLVSSKKRGRAPVIKLETTDSASESSTPARKRGRRGANQTETSVEKIPPSRGRGRQTKLKVIENVVDEEETTDSTPVKPVVQPKSTRSRRPSSKETETPQVVSEQDTSENKSQKKPTRNRRLLTPSHVASSDGEQTHSANTESEDKSAKKPAVRGRRGPAKKPTSAENASHTEEEQPASATKKKITRARKPVVKANSSTEKEVEEPNTDHGTKANVNDEDVSEEPNKKPSRGRKAAHSQSDVAEQTAEEELSTATTKPTRGRKAATKANAAKDTDEEIEPQKKPTRSRKAVEPAPTPEPAPEAATKRVNRRNLEIPTDDDTPSKRVRRKPKHLLSDELVH